MAASCSRVRRRTPTRLEADSEALRRFESSESDSRRGKQERANAGSAVMLLADSESDSRRGAADERKAKWRSSKPVSFSERSVRVAPSGSRNELRDGDCDRKEPDESSGFPERTKWLRFRKPENAFTSIDLMAFWSSRREDNDEDIELRLKTRILPI